ncbi:MAG: hypothetical protein LBL94_00630 [Prevotellaceae bacterium]|jgi:hypothetical protein|nr:hypothetical protein [Prevotellaceae bacterium]
MVEISVLEQVESFYSSAWDKLILCGLIVFVLLGVALPAIFYAVNVKLFKAKQSEKFHQLKLETLAEIRNENREELAQVKQDFYNKSKALKSMALHLEGNALIKEQKIEQASLNYLDAIKGYLHGKDYVNFRLLINTLIDKCLPKLDKLLLATIFRRMDTTEEQYFLELKKIDRTEYARQEIAELRIQMESVKPVAVKK